MFCYAVVGHDSLSVEAGKWGAVAQEGASQNVVFGVSAVVAQVESLSTLLFRCRELPRSIRSDFHGDGPIG